MFDYFKKAAISKRADDELLYEYVLNEIEKDIIVKGLWAKALANSAGDNAHAKSIYMQYRVQSIKDVFTAQKIAYNELNKPSLYKYIEDKILPLGNDYSTLTKEQKQITQEDYKVSKEEEALYEEVANELAEGIKKEGLWLKALENTEGNEVRARTLYTKYRVESIKAMRVDEARLEKEEKSLEEENERKQKMREYTKQWKQAEQKRKDIQRHRFIFFIFILLSALGIMLIQ